MRPPGLLSAPSLPSCPQVLDVPVTVKMRTGVQERVSLAHRLLPELRDWGVALVTVGVLVPRFLSLSGSLLSPPNPATFHPHHCTPPPPQLHGRSREQRYTRLADWPYIKQCAEVASPMPLFGRCPEPLSCCVSQLGRQGSLGPWEVLPSTMGPATVKTTLSPQETGTFSHSRTPTVPCRRVSQAS